MNYQEVIKELHGKLEDYLKSQGVEITSNGFFCCIHPDHPDRYPSASLNYGNELKGKVFHCFSGRSHDGNIFTAAHWLEGLPLQGHDFWEHTMVELCKRYNIDYEPLEVDEGTRRQYQAYKATRDAAKIIHNMIYDGDDLKDHVGIRHLLERGVTRESIEKWGIGVLTSFKDYKHGIQQLGHNDENFLYSKDLMNKNLFNRDSFIIPIHDHSSRVVGFVTRNCRINPNDHVTRKYINTINTDIYEKGSILFGYHRIKNMSGPLYIVEGYLDAIMLEQAGLQKVVAIGATVLTNHHITETLFNDQTDIILCLDADKGGEDGVKLALERMACYRKFNVTIIDLPRDYDPDTYVREFGIEAFQALEKLSPFAWSLKHSEYSDDMTIVAEKMIPIIAAEESSITRLRMIRDLSNYTAIPELDIRRDVDALVSKEDDKYLQGIRDINQYAGAQLSRRKVSDTKSILRDALNKVEILDEKHNSVKDMQNEYMNKLQHLDNKLQEGDFKYGLLCPKHKGIETTLDGIPYWTCMTLFGGRPSAGKSLRPGTQVLMYNGNIKKIEDVKVGDQLMGPDSNPRNVLALGTGEEEMYDIIPKRGMKWGCNEPHILSLRMSSDNGDVYKKDDIINLPIKDYMCKNTKFKHHAKQWRTGWELPTKRIPYDAYYIGSWLGDGSKDSAEITTGDPEYVESYYKAFANKFGFRMSKYHQERNTYVYRMCKTSGKTNPLLNYLRDKCLVNNEKRIPKEYLHNSRTIRLELLAGLIDTDGYLVRKDSGTYEITTKYARLRDDILYLGNSLGFLSTYSDKKVTIKEGDVRTYYRIHISGNIREVPVKIERKKSITSNRRTNHQNVGFDIKHTGKGKYYGVVLDNDHLFLLADGTVTHNTAFMTDLSLDIVEANDDAAIFYMSIDDNMDLLTTKMLAVRSGLSTTEIKGYKDLRGEDRDSYHEAMQFLKNNADRFIIADAIQGNSVDALENHVRWFCREFKDQKKVFLLDNFHKLRMEIRGQTRKSDAISDTSQQIKEITQLNDIHIMSTVELRKLQTNTDRPTRNDMQGSAKLDYDADVIGLVHNDMQVNRNTRLVHYQDVHGKSRAMPWIELSIDKNKINGKDSQIVYKYNKHNMQFSEGSTKDFYKLKDQMKQRNINF